MLLKHIFVDVVEGAVRTDPHLQGPGVVGTPSVGQFDLATLSQVTLEARAILDRMGGIVRALLYVKLGGRGATSAP